MLSFQSMFQVDKAGTKATTIGFCLGGKTFQVRIAEGALTSARTENVSADVIFTATSEALAAYVYGKASLEGMEAAGTIAVAGDRDSARAFQTFFALPAQANRPA